MPVSSRSTIRGQILFLVTVLLLGLQSLTTPTIISAAEQEIPRRHSLIHRSDVESAALPATTQGTILQPSGTEPTRIMSPIEPPKTSDSLPAMPLPHHRTLTKRPTIASITAPAASSQTLPGALTSGIATEHVPQTTADTTKGSPSTATAPVTKSAAISLSGVISTGAASTAATSPSPLTGSASVHSAASAGSGCRERLKAQE